LVNGYCLLEVYASLSRKNPVAILLEPFSHEEPCSPAQNPVVPAGVHKIFELTNKRGVLAVVRGFDGWALFENPLDNEYRFVARRPSRPNGWNGTLRKASRCLSSLRVIGDYCGRQTCFERLNKEIRRRTHVAGLFPNEGSLLRLAGARRAFASSHPAGFTKFSRFLTP